MNGDELESSEDRYDQLTPEQRSERMGHVRSKDTGIELQVRRLVHSLGFRYRLHRRDLPGHPDLVFPGRKKVIFVHGCFWHGHEKCRQYRMPKSRLDFWIPKLEGNKVRDERNQQMLRDMGWQVLVVWECELRDHDALAARVKAFLGG